MASREAYWLEKLTNTVPADSTVADAAIYESPTPRVYAAASAHVRNAAAWERFVSSARADLFAWPGVVEYFTTVAGPPKDGDGLASYASNALVEVQSRMDALVDLTPTFRALEFVATPGNEETLSKAVHDVMQAIQGPLPPADQLFVSAALCRGALSSGTEDAWSRYVRYLRSTEQPGAMNRRLRMCRAAARWVPSSASLYCSELRAVEWAIIAALEPHRHADQAAREAAVLQALHDPTLVVVAHASGSAGVAGPPGTGLIGQLVELVESCLDNRFVTPADYYTSVMEASACLRRVSDLAREASTQLPPATCEGFKSACHTWYDRSSAFMKQWFPNWWGAISNLNRYWAQAFAECWDDVSASDAAWDALISPQDSSAADTTSATVPLDTMVEVCLAAVACARQSKRYDRCRGMYRACVDKLLAGMQRYDTMALAHGLISGVTTSWADFEGAVGSVRQLEEAEAATTAAGAAQAIAADNMAAAAASAQAAAVEAAKDRRRKRRRGDDDAPDSDVLSAADGSTDKAAHAVRGDAKQADRKRRKTAQEHTDAASNEQTGTATATSQEKGVSTVDVEGTVGDGADDAHMQAATDGAAATGPPASEQPALAAAPSDGVLALRSVKAHHRVKIKLDSNVHASEHASGSAAEAHAETSGSAGSSSGGAAGPVAQPPAPLDADATDPKAIFFRHKPLHPTGQLQLPLTVELASPLLQRFGKLSDIRVATDAAGKSKDFGVALFDDAAAAAACIAAGNASVSDGRLQFKACKASIVQSWLLAPAKPATPAPAPEDPEQAKRNAARLLALKPRSIRK